MDLTLDNIQLGEDFRLKISDFDYAYQQEDPTFMGNGTADFRAPEVQKRVYGQPEKADIYSMGIILFAMKAGYLPYSENNKNDRAHGYQQILFQDTKHFWGHHRKVVKADNCLDEEFKELFVSMTKRNPEERTSIREIKSSPWYREEIYTHEELVERMKNILAIIPYNDRT